MIEQIKEALPEIESHLSISTVDYLRDVRYLIGEVEGLNEERKQVMRGNTCDACHHEILENDKLRSQVEELQKTLADIAESDDEWYVGRIPMREYARETLHSLKEDKPNDPKPML